MIFAAQALHSFFRLADIRCYGFADLRDDFYGFAAPGHNVFAFAFCCRHRIALHRTVCFAQAFRNGLRNALAGACCSAGIQNSLIRLGKCSALLFRSSGACLFAGGSCLFRGGAGRLACLDFLIQLFLCRFAGTLTGTLAFFQTLFNGFLRGLTVFNAGGKIVGKPCAGCTAIGKAGLLVIKGYLALAGLLV